MKVSEFVRRFGHLGDYEMVLSKIGVLVDDGEDEFEGILDCPVNWIATNDDDKEVRFVVSKETSKHLGRVISEV